jgi:hypothetical protein
MTIAPQVREAVYGALVTAWNNTTPLCLDNEVYTPVPGSAWARGVVREMTSQQWTLGPVGGRKFKRQAHLIVQIFTPPDAGTTQADVLASIVRDAFEGDPTPALSIGWNAVVVKELGNLNGWYQVQATASFWYDEVK